MNATNREPPTAVPTPDWQATEVTEVFAVLEAPGAGGLQESEAAERRSQFGRNVLTARPGQGPIIRFLLQFHQPLVYILLASSAITAALQEWVDSAVIFGVVMVNAVIGFLQESRATRAIEALARSLDVQATVLRDGNRIRLSAAQLVPGDVVILQSGDKVPADLRLFQVRDLQVDESALTGESVPVAKNVRLLGRDSLLPDRSNMAYSSTLVTYGVGRGVVVATGDATEIGRINELISSADVLATPLTRKIGEFSHRLLWVILGLALLTFVVGMLRGQGGLEMFMAAVALAVAAIPEGLPAAMTITLAIGVGRMARRNAILRKLPAVETLGSTTVICSDKTGTLTQNQMTVTDILVGERHYRLTGTGYAPEGDFELAGERVLPHEDPVLVETLIAGVLCNEARLAEEQGHWRVEGDPTEAALLSAGAKAGLRADHLGSEHPRIDSVPFESQHQYMATLHRRSDGRFRIYVKGSVEQLLERCALMLGSDGREQPIDRATVLAAVNRLAGEGLRVLAFASRSLECPLDSLEHGHVAGQLTFLGVQAMIDPPRPEAIDAVAVCQRAGMQVKMITGDHLATASAIADRLGLLGAGHSGVMEGRELADMDDDRLLDRVGSTAVFARVAPEQKLRLVQALQRQSHVVAMTGDGVNDAPALRQADIGVAMGVAGTEVAKEAADMVLTDDNFATIAAAVEEGRTVYDNLVKFITWTLPTNVGEGLVVMVAVFAGLSLPMLPVQILWVNMSTAVLLGLMLAFERKERAIMLRPPRPPDKPVLTSALVFRVVVVGILLLIGAFGLFQWELSHGESEAAARTVAVNLFVFGEMFYLFNCRSLTRSAWSLGFFSNRWLVFGAAGMTAAQLVFTYWPPMNAAFGTEPLGWEEWGLILLFAALIYGVVGLEKSVRHRRERPAQNPVRTVKEP